MAADSVFSRLATATEQHMWGLPRLSDREKVLLSVVGDVCNQTLGLPFELHVKAGLERGVSTGDLRELLRGVAFETGYPAASAALERLTAIEAALGVTAAETRADSPAETIAPPAQVRASWREVDEGFGDYMELQSAMVAALPGLSVRERAFAAITCDVLYQTLQDTFRIHVGRALGGGAEPDDIRDVLRFTCQFGVARTWNAFRALDKCLAEIGHM